MKHPEKWRETVNPYQLPYQNFELKEILGYPHAGNDVFHAKGIYRQQEVEVFIKAARQHGADIQNEIDVIRALEHPLVPQIIDYDMQKEQFVVSLAKTGDRLSIIVGDNADKQSLRYMYEYGRTLAGLHGIKGIVHKVKDRKFFHIPEKSHFESSDFMYVRDYLVEKQPVQVNECFCHGDFHFANILWENEHISAILDFELAGWGNKEFDIAWALILRPGQKFLNTQEEIDLFLEGYASQGTYDKEAVKYYMVLIYTYFYKFKGNSEEYLEYIKQVFRACCV